jgi:putative transposase
MQKVLKGYKYRIYPTEEQKKFLSQQFGSVRWIYNHFLAKRKDDYLNNKKTLNYHDDAKALTELKSQDGYEWLYNINSQTLQSALRNLDSAYLRFFKKQARFPNFHKKSNRQSIKIPQHFKVVSNYLHIPKLKTTIKIKLHQKLPENKECLFISRNPSGEYYAVFLCEVEVQELPKNNISIGIDLGLKDLVITSEGAVFQNHKFYRASEKQLKFQQIKLSRKKKGSKNRNKQRIKIAKLYQKVSNKRSDELHKITHQLVSENQVIIAESLSVKNMIKNHKLAKNIQDASWGELIRQIEYKSKWYGRTFHQIDKFFPSSKTCNSCQFVIDVLPLNIREWDCPKCNRHHDRDLNAALNIKDKGLKDLGLWNVTPHQKLSEASAIAESMT